MRERASQLDEKCREGHTLQGLTITPVPLFRRDRKGNQERNPPSKGRQKKKMVTFYIYIYILRVCVCVCVSLDVYEERRDGKRRGGSLR